MNIQVPKHINDITLKEYQRFALINNEEQDKEFFIHKTIEIFCGVDIRKVYKMRLKDAEALSNELIELLQHKHPFTPKMTLNGVKYGFIPDLENISLGEFIDLEEALSDAKNFHKAAAVMYRPIIKEHGDLYTIDGYEASSKAHNIMLDAPIGNITAAIVFFYDIARELQMDLRAYSQERLETLTTTLENLNSQQNTGGSIHFMPYVEVMRQSIAKLRNSTI